MKPLAIIIGIVFLAGVLVAGCVALVNDEDSLGRVELVSHEYRDGGDCEWEGDCGGQYSSGGDYGHNRRDDRHRNRGAFSPGPFDRSPVDFSNSCISLDCSGRDEGRRRRRDEPPPDDPQRTQSLFPPTPDGIKQFVLTTIQAGIELGRLFADTTITFVSNLLVGIA